MKWANVRLIFGREVRDQLRDRRTLFMIAVLPLLLYPLMGMAFLQVSQFLKANPSRVYVVGIDELPATPPLIEDGKIVASLCSVPSKQSLFSLTLGNARSWDPRDPAGSARRLMADGAFDAVLYFPPRFGRRLRRFGMSVGRQASPSGPMKNPVTMDVPSPAIFFSTARDKSVMARDRIAAVVARWRQQVVDQTLVAHQVSERVTQPFDLIDNDLADTAGRRTALWSKMLPFVLLVWALTGAFYPAIDVCAGEKERGTLETLLSSPAERSEIVLGKLLTIMLFSVITALLNLLCMTVAATFIVAQLQGLGPAGGGLQWGPPPLAALWWLGLAVIPISALFSALSLALATMARSTKEGQYYLMPLLVIAMPLMVLPVLPAAELNLGTSLIPITGVMLLLRSLMEGQYHDVALYLLPATGVTAGCCLLAIRWAIDQFNNEFVLFRESERLELGRWLVHLVRDRQDTPTASEALMVGVLLLLIRFFVGLMLPVPDTWNLFATIALVSTIGMIAVPALGMTWLLSRRPRQTLLLSRPPAGSVSAAIALAVCLHPLAMALTVLVQHLYPIRSEVSSLLDRWLQQAPSIWMVLLVMALIPAICEELAFRGFLLTGLRRAGHKWQAIVVSSTFFGLAHGLLQQSLMATMAGMVLGYVAIQTGSLLPCMVLHCVHNSLALVSSRWLEAIWELGPQYRWLLQTVGDQHIYGWPIVLVSALLAWLVLRWFRGLAYAPTAEEQLQQALHRQATHQVPIESRAHS